MAGTTQAGGRGRGGIVGINVTPMVDVVLVLLVIMMVSATYIVAQSIRVELPKASTGESSGSTAPTTVTVTRSRALLFNNEPVTEPALVERLRGVQRNDAETTVVITADREAPHGVVVHVMDVARDVGLTKFAINVESER